MADSKRTHPPQADPFTLNSIVLIQDSREQTGYKDLFHNRCIIEGLNVGDYSAVGLQDRIVVERKSMSDLVGSLTAGRKRFEEEFRRARSLDFFAVIVEGSLSEVLEGRYRSTALPEAIFQSVMSWTVRYGRAFIFCETREIGAKTTESLILKFARSFLQSAADIRRAHRRIDAA